MADKLSIGEVLPAAVRYWRGRGRDSWGSLHVVLSDGNVEDEFVVGCIDWAVAHDDADGAELGRMLLRLSKTQRWKLQAMVRDEEHRIGPEGP